MFHPKEKILYSSCGRGFAASHICTDAIKYSYSYWNGAAVQGAMPKMSRFDPVQMSFLLKNIMMIGVEYSPPAVRFKIRVMGTSLVECYGFEGTNRYVEDCLDPKTCTLFKKGLLHVVESSEPLLVRKTLPENERGYKSCESIYLPYGCDQGKVGKVLVVKEFLPGQIY